MSGPDWRFLSDSASAARQGRATKNEKMSSPCTSRLALQSGLQALREIGKPVAASEEELPRWWPRYGPVSFLIAFWSTLCTVCTLVHYVHFVHLRPHYLKECTNVQVLFLCALLCTLCTVCTSCTKEHRIDKCAQQCTFC